MNLLTIPTHQESSISLQNHDQLYGEWE